MLVNANILQNEVEQLKKALNEQDEENRQLRLNV
jgi:hypothetical protein